MRTISIIIKDDNDNLSSFQRNYKILLENGQFEIFKGVNTQGKFNQSCNCLKFVFSQIANIYDNEYNLFLDTEDKRLEKEIEDIQTKLKTLQSYQAITKKLKMADTSVPSVNKD